MKKLIAFAMAVAMTAAPAAAQRRVNFAPIDGVGGNVRYNRGLVSVEQTSETGAVQVTPLGLEHNRLTFAVAVLNTGEQQDNFGTEDISASVAGNDVLVLSRDVLERQAQRRAAWQTFAVALAAGAGAAAAANTRDTHTFTTITPRGTYRSVYSAPSVAGQVAAAGIAAGGAYSISQIQNQLDATRDALGNEIIQTTTIDPQDSYAGRIVLATLPRGHNRWPQDINLVVRFGGHEYPFAFRVTR